MVQVLQASCGFRLSSSKEVLLCRCVSGEGSRGSGYMSVVSVLRLTLMYLFFFHILCHAT
jgi:hypothetical protein